jgi:hypothetical protein
VVLVFDVGGAYSRVEGSGGPGGTGGTGGTGTLDGRGP